jgi:signal transduction histidine kinase
MASERSLDAQALLDGLGQGALLFDSANRFVLGNQMARSILGTDLRAFQIEGWLGAVGFFDRYLTDSGDTLDQIRARALTSERPARFHIYRDGALVSCWAGAVHGKSGELYTMIVLEMPDWGMVNDLLHRYIVEVKQGVQEAAGHARLINQSTESPKSNQSVEQLGRRVGGFARLINVQMHRLERLTSLVIRLDAIRTGAVVDQARQERKKVVLKDFFEDFVESLDETPLLDPETTTDSPRSRLKVIVPQHLSLRASPLHLSLVLRDILRNAIMYSMRGTPITIVAYAGSKESTVQIDVTDEGCGIRASEFGRVFTPFERARQPQIISEFGYGISLYLCKHEVEAMNGLMWFESQEGSGTIMSLRLPAWRGEPTSSVSSAV